MDTPEIRIRSWVRAKAGEEHRGLLGYLSVFYGDLILDSIVLRRTAAGRLALSFPARTSRSGQRHPYVRPVDDEARRSIELTILGQLGQRRDPGVEAEAGDE